eukprot:TRINITY_DN11577_c0_g1_i1.p1 TRINITY_DN11577_c0_g1~~TRINITY_DN11577_c0_g1_i1.p1  ORF type:complete len:232 (+),score=24.67 TRINITY_DN11577_c0_g1_i1:376-1071(+)
MAATRAITHIIFDMDGLLLDTESFYTTVQKKILARYGKDFTYELKAKMMGKRALEAGRVLIAETGLGDVLTAEAFIKEREDMLHDLFPTSQLMPGAERLVRHLHGHRIPMAVATSSHRKHFELKTTLHKEVFALMHHVVVGDDPEVSKGKPDPEIFLLARSRFEAPLPSPEQCLVFEDAPIGVEAANKAGMPVVMVPHDWIDPEQTKQATERITSLNNFDPLPWGLPAFQE